MIAKFKYEKDKAFKKYTEADKEEDEIKRIMNQI
jgi:hypothetical protein